MDAGPAHNNACLASQGYTLRSWLVSQLCCARPMCYMTDDQMTEWLTGCRASVLLGPGGGDHGVGLPGARGACLLLVCAPRAAHAGNLLDRRHHQDLDVAYCGRQAPRNETLHCKTSGQSPGCIGCWQLGRYILTSSNVY